MMEFEFVESREYRLAKEYVKGELLLDLNERKAKEFRQIQAAYENGKFPWRATPLSVIKRYYSQQLNGTPDKAEYSIAFQTNGLAMIHRKEKPGMQKSWRRPVHAMGVPMPTRFWNDAAGVNDNIDRLFAYQPFFKELGKKSMWMVNYEGFTADSMAK